MEIVCHDNNLGFDILAKSRSFVIQHADTLLQRAMSLLERVERTTTIHLLSSTSPIQLLLQRRDAALQHPKPLRKFWVQVFRHHGAMLLCDSSRSSLFILNMGSDHVTRLAQQQIAPDKKLDICNKYFVIGAGVWVYAMDRGLIGDASPCSHRIRATHLGEFDKLEQGLLFWRKEAKDFFVAVAASSGRVCREAKIF